MGQLSLPYNLIPALERLNIIKEKQNMFDAKEAVQVFSAASTFDREHGAHAAERLDSVAKFLASFDTTGVLAGLVSTAKDALESIKGTPLVQQHTARISADTLAALRQEALDAAVSIPSAFTYVAWKKAYPKLTQTISASLQRTGHVKGTGLLKKRTYEVVERNQATKVASAAAHA